MKQRVKDGLTSSLLIFTRFAPLPNPTFYRANLLKVCSFKEVELLNPCAVDV